MLERFDCTYFSDEISVVSFQQHLQAITQTFTCVSNVIFTVLLSNLAESLLSSPDTCAITTYGDGSLSPRGLKGRAQNHKVKNTLKNTFT